MRGAIRLVFLCAGLLVAPLASAQTSTGLAVGVLTLDRDRLYSESLMGQEIEQRYQAELDALAADNRKLETALQEEEQALTERRATVDAATFQSLAAAFDTKVEGLRQAQDAKSRDITQRREAERAAFFEDARPLIATLMTERGAGAIIDRATTIFALDALDVTDQAIARLDAIFRGETPAPLMPPMSPPADPAPPLVPQPAPEPAPEPAPATAETAPEPSELAPATPSLRPQPRPEPRP